MGIDFVFRKRLIEEFAKGPIPIAWVELQKLLLWYDGSYMVVVIMEGLDELLAIVAVPTGPYIHDVVQELPVGTNSNL